MQVAINKSITVVRCLLCIFRWVVAWKVSVSGGHGQVIPKTIEAAISLTSLDQPTLPEKTD